MRSLWKRDFRQGAVLLLAGLIPVLPWILRNVILSGYLVYPVAATGIPGLDWKMPLDTLERDVAGIRNWSYHIGNRKILEYIPFWLTGIRTQYKIIVYPAVIAFAVSAVYFVITRLFRIIHQQKQPMWNWRYVPLLAFSYIGVLYMFLTAPDVRYGSGIFIMFGVIHFAPIAVVLLKKYRPLLLRVYPVAVLSFMAVFSVYLFYRHYFREPDPDKPRMFDRENVSVVSMRMLMPADYENATKYSVLHVLGNGLLEYYTPKLIDRCWYDPFPSVPRPVPDVELRGNKVTSGFRHRQQSGQ